MVARRGCPGPEKKLTNYWGYNTIGFFAPDPRCAADVVNGLREFKEMVSKLHSTGLEVILDVVYNHTADGNELGPTLFKASSALICLPECQIKRPRRSRTGAVTRERVVRGLGGSRAT